MSEKKRKRPQVQQRIDALCHCTEMYSAHKWPTHIAQSDRNAEVRWTMNCCASTHSNDSDVANTHNHFETTSRKERLTTHRHAQNPIARLDDISIQIKPSEQMQHIVVWKTLQHRSDRVAAICKSICMKRRQPTTWSLGTTGNTQR